MAYVALPSKLWVPNWYWQVGGGYPGTVLDQTLDADEEEWQWIGHVHLATGPGTTKTFGGGSSAIGWLSGASVAFVATATLRIGAKSSAVIDAATGPAARATIGAAAFSAYTDLTGGTHTISTTTWRNDTIGSGTPFSVTHGDLIAICFHLETTAGVQSVKIRGATAPIISRPTGTLVTTGPTYTVQNLAPNARLTFSDGTVGWIDGSWIHSVTATTETIGASGNIYGNVFQLPFACKVDAVASNMITAGTTNFDIGLWSDPSGTPTAMTNGTVSVDPNQLGTASMSWQVYALPALIELAATTDYFVACKQNSATNLTVSHFTVDNVADLACSGGNTTCYAAKSTAGAAVVIQPSGTALRRAGFYARIAEVDVTAAASSGGKMIG